MIVGSSPVCPRCRKCVMSRGFSKIDYVAMVAFIFLFFPLTIWLYLSPRYLVCRNCGNVLTEGPAA